VKAGEDNVGSLNFRAERPAGIPASVWSASAHPGVGTGGAGSLVRGRGGGSRRM